MLILIIVDSGVDKLPCAIRRYISRTRIWHLAYRDDRSYMSRLDRAHGADGGGILEGRYSAQ